MLPACRVPSAISRAEPSPIAPELAAAAATLQNARDDAQRAYALVASLTTEVGPRLPGSAGDLAAVAWAQRTMLAQGLVNVHTEPVTVPRWERGEARAAILAPFAQPLVLTALGNSVATPAGGLAAEVVEVANLASLARLDDAAVKGRIVFFNQRTLRTRDGSGYGQAVGVRSRGPAAAAKKGAVAALVRSIGTAPHRMPHTGGTWYAKDVPPIPAAALAHADADLLSAQLKTGQPVRVSLLLTPRVDGQAQSHNVVGEVRGREKPEEIVLLGAHLDSWDLGHGAIDDAAGCAIVLEAARRIAALPRPPRRTVRVVLYAAEEIGILGARAYALAHAAELAKHVLAVEADFGGAPVYALSARVAPSAQPQLAAIATLLRPLGVALLDDEAHGGADLNPLLHAGVPVAELQQEGAKYFDVHHTADDTADKVDARELDQAVRAFATFAHAAAELPGDFGRLPPRTPAR